jgi:hypothetical protein
MGFRHGVSMSGDGSKTLPVMTLPSQERVSVTLNVAEKEAITVLASITAAHDKFPLFLIAQRKTQRVEPSQLGPR